MSERADLLARIEALERESRRAFDEAQREADALFAQYQLSQMVASGGRSRVWEDRSPSRSFDSPGSTTGRYGSADPTGRR